MPKHTIPPPWVEGVSSFWVRADDGEPSQEPTQEKQKGGMSMEAGCGCQGIQAALLIKLHLQSTDSKRKLRISRQLLVEHQLPGL